MSDPTWRQSREEYDRDPEVEMEYAKVNMLAGCAEIVYGVLRWLTAAVHAAEEYANGTARQHASQSDAGGSQRPSARRTGGGGRYRRQTRRESP